MLVHRKPKLQQRQEAKARSKEAIHRCVRSGHGVPVWFAPVRLPTESNDAGSKRFIKRISIIGLTPHNKVARAEWIIKPVDCGSTMLPKTCSNPWFLVVVGVRDIIQSCGAMRHRRPRCHAGSKQFVWFFSRCPIQNTNKATSNFGYQNKKDQKPKSPRNKCVWRKGR